MPFNPSGTSALTILWASPSTIRRLADPRLPDQHRVILGPSLQYLDGPADLVITSDHWIELALLGALGEIDGEFFERPAVLFRIRIGHGFAASDRVDRVRDRYFRRAIALQEIGNAPARFEAGEHEQLARYELILSVLCELVAEIEMTPELARYLHVAGHAGDPRQRVEHDAELRA